jgi:hypothetical protein
VQGLGCSLEDGSVVGGNSKAKGGAAKGKTKAGKWELELDCLVRMFPSCMYSRGQSFAGFFLPSSLDARIIDSLTLATNDYG